MVSSYIYIINICICVFLKKLFYLMKGNNSYFYLFMYGVYIFSFKILIFGSMFMLWVWLL